MRIQDSPKLNLGGSSKLISHIPSRHHRQKWQVSACSSLKSRNTSCFLLITVFSCVNHYTSATGSIGLLNDSSYVLKPRVSIIKRSGHILHLRLAYSLVMSKIFAWQDPSTITNSSQSDRGCWYRLFKINSQP